MPLPTAPVVADLNPERLRGIITGPPGAGKTTLAAGWFPQSNLILDTQGGTRFLPGAHFVQPIGSFSEFCATVNELVAGGHPYRTVTIDTIDKLVRMADGEAGVRGGKTAAALVEYGKGLADRDAVVLRELGKLLASDLGVIVVAHPFIKEVVVGKKPDGSDLTAARIFPRIDPNDRITQEVIGEFDFLFNLRKHHDESRDLLTGGHAGFETKRRVPMPDVLPADAGALHQAIVEGVAALQAQPVAA